MRGLRAAALRCIRICVTAAVAGVGAQRCAGQSMDEGGRVDGSLRYLALGDSYTIGEGVEPAERWPVQLAALLRARGVDLGDPTIIARTGWTTDELASGIDAVRPPGPYDLVSLLIGVNNQYHGFPVAAYRPELRAMLQRAIAFAGGEAGRVVVVSIPDWGVTPYAQGRDRAQTAREVDAYNAAARDVAGELGAHWVDVTPTSRGMPAALVGDGLHPSGEQYRAWAELALPEALKALRR